MKGIIYVLKFSDEKFYIGSTSGKMYDRFYFHKRDLLNGNESKLYKHWRLLGEIPEIEIIEEFEFKILNELHLQERNFVMNYIDDENCLNSYNPKLTDSERKLYNALNSKNWRNKKQNKIE